MIDELVTMGALSRVRTESGLVGYRFVDALHEAYEELDAALVGAVPAELRPNPHTCTSILDARVLEKINFFDTLPVVPMHAIPHIDGAIQPRSPGWVLTPSTCYHTFAHLEGTHQDDPLRAYTARGTCHRYEPSPDDETRLGSFTMREVVLVGERARVEEEADRLFAGQMELLRRLLGEVVVEPASDIFYGRLGRVARAMQVATGVKLEGRASWGDGTISVASRNLHHTVFTTAFDIGPARQGDVLHSACVAFGLERIVLAALALQPAPEPKRLLAAVRSART
jgi:hypothetical protein